MKEAAWPSACARRHGLAAGLQRRTLPPGAEETAALRFVMPGVDSNVKNAALGKLFSDPRFNVMDGLDVYIDDYNTPDPLPASMLRQMTQSRLLGLFDDAPAAQTPPNPIAPTTPTAPSDEDTDLRLQPDHAAGRDGPAASPGDDAGRQH